MAQVVKLAQPGYDVKTAGDENLIYSSEWPIPKIYLQNNTTIPDVTKSFTITTHDLQFPPFFWFFSNSTIGGWLNSGAVLNQNRSEFFGPTANGTISINENNLIYTPTTGTTGSLNLYYYIFALDLSKQYIAPIIKVGSISGGDSQNFVFKLAKEGKNVSSNNLDDFVIHSRARTPLIHSVNPSQGVTKSFTVTHKLGYNPIFFGFTKVNGYYTMIATGSGGSSNFTSTDQIIQFNDTGGKEITIVILKDPFDIDYTVQVNI